MMIYRNDLLEEGSVHFQKCVDIWNKQWDDICCYLSNNESEMPKFEDLIGENIFCNVTSQIIKYSEEYTTYSKQIRQLYKGVHEEDASKISPDRFIPKWEFVSDKRPNRMNGIDRLYNYFAIDYNDCGDRLPYYTVARELRLNKSDAFWISKFRFNDEKKLKFADLRTKEKIPKDDIRCYKFLRSKATHNGKLKRIDDAELEKWIIQVLLGVWENSKMFAPVDKTHDDLWLQYRPFHLICDFFERQGFDGIIYRSTVYKQGACLALFNINNAYCIPESIEKIDEGKYR